MSDLDIRKKDRASQSGIDAEGAELFISQCAEVGEDQLKSYLSHHIAETEKEIVAYSEAIVRKYVRVITKGLRQKSKQAGALRYYYYGYYIRQQEELLEKQRKKVIASARNILISRRHYADILRYLFEHGCVQQKDISVSLDIDKSNLNRIMGNLVEHDLVVRSIGPRCVFFELSSSGYTFMREQSLLENSVAKARIASPLENRLESFKVEYKEAPRNKDNTAFRVGTTGGAYGVIALRSSYLASLENMLATPSSNLAPKSKGRNEVLDVKVDMTQLGIAVGNFLDNTHCQDRKRKNKFDPEIFIGTNSAIGR